MYTTGNLIPAKFLILVAHFTIITSLLWSSQRSLRICLPENSSTDEYTNSQYIQLVTGLSLTLGFIVFEFLVFVTGLTMFDASSALLSISCHAGACITLGYLIFDSWKCSWYWWLFALGSAIPALNDFSIVCDLVVHRKY